MAKKEKVNKSKRRFLKFGILAGSVLALGGYLRFCGEVQKAPEEVWNDDPSTFTPGAWLRVNSDGAVTVRVNHSEMGQGITTALAMIVAEELEADWSKIAVEVAPAESVYKNPEFNLQLTAASTSVKTSWDILRNAGACAREMLVSAAAMKWKVPVSACRAHKGAVIHEESGRKLKFGELASTAAGLPLPKTFKLKNVNRFNLIGQKIARLDSAEKVNGRSRFGIDVDFEGLLNATVVHPPVFETKPQKVDSRHALSLPGVRHIVEIDSGVAVVADTFWQAKQGADLLDIEWEAGGLQNVSSDNIRNDWIGMAHEEGKQIFSTGNFEKSWVSAEEKIEAVYELPYQAHATPEPMNCTAHVQKDRCVIWAPTQNQDGAQEIAAKITGLGYDKINVHTTYLGGGFGRRVEVDYVAEAVQISKAINAPVKVIWTREEDMRHDVYRPATYNVLQAGLNRESLPIAWAHKIVGTDHMAQRLPNLIPSTLPYFVPRGARNLVSTLARTILPRVIPGKKASEGAAPLSYAIDAVQVNFVDSDPGIPTGFWRSVAYSQNVFIVESFMDEIAFAAGKDPVELRHALLSNDHRLRKVLELAAEKSGWGKRRQTERHQGVAVLNFHDTRLCIVAQVSVNKDGGIRVHRVVCAVDCGIVVNPKIVEAQIEGGIAFGLSATLKGSITINKGRVEQSNFDTFPILRMDEMPLVEVHLVDNPGSPSGIGEAAVPLIAPAVTNAIFAATGKRIRSLPINSDKLLN
jgi:CO/xanthine dehydrogenase Mo-binding subunit